MDTLESYRETYKRFSDDELVRLYPRIADLEELARIALHEELTNRGYDQAKLTASAAELKQLDMIAGLQLPSLIRPYGIGRKFFGRKNVSILEGGKIEEYDTTLWFVLFGCPLIPLASYRIRQQIFSRWLRGTYEPAAVARYSRDWQQITATWVKTVLLIVAVYVSLQLIISPPKFWRRHKSVFSSHVTSRPLFHVFTVN